jgi:homoserine kinase
MSPRSPVVAGTRIEGLVDDALVSVRVPATSANLGPGFDSLGLALTLHDNLQLSVHEKGFEVQVEGEGAREVPDDGTHLVIRAALAGLAHVGIVVPGLKLVCHNMIPHGRGLGSSAAAVVAGLIGARGLLVDPSMLPDQIILQLATGFEGHPDNAAAVVFGGFTISWMDHAAGSPEEPGSAARAVRLVPDPRVRVVACVPAVQLSTREARAMLPATVPHPDAAFNAGRSALLVEAVAHRPDLLLVATDDRLHQAQRSSAMPASAALIATLRGSGLAAVVSGAGPTVLVLGMDGADPSDSLYNQVSAAVETAQTSDVAWRLLDLRVDSSGAQATT